MWTSRKEFTLRFPSAAGREHKIDRAWWRLLLWIFHRRWHSVDRFFQSCVQSFSSRRYGKRRRARDCGIDKRTEWQQVNSGFDLYEPKSGACQLGISVSYFNYCVRHDLSAPVRMGRGMIACNTPALQEWWNGKNHHRVIEER